LLGGDFRAKDCVRSRVKILALINAFETDSFEAITLYMGGLKMGYEMSTMAGMAYAKVEVGWCHGCMRKPQTLCITHTLMNLSINHVHFERQNFLPLSGAQKPHRQSSNVAAVLVHNATCSKSGVILHTPLMKVSSRKDQSPYPHPTPPSPLP
jgi:hypothetical protein